jgi:FAD synthetase
MENLGNFFYSKVLPAAQIIKTCQFLYGNIILAFNGGKDCTVLLEIAEYFNIDIPIIIFEEPDTFKTLTKFTLDRVLRSPLKKKFLSPDIKVEIGFLVKSGVKGVVLGERFLDPGKPTSFISDSSEGWGDYKIINPIFNWTYSDVWFFLDHIGAQYCELYNFGYTSIGSEIKTKPNPELRGRHARELMNPLHERIGRL